MSKRVALLIGVSEYGEGIPSLSAPPNDVAAVERVLKDPKMGCFDEVTPVINPDVPAMQTAIERIFKSLAKDDLVLLFFSGHGITDDRNRLYLTTKGTSKDIYKATSVPASFIQDMSQDCYAKRQVIILDCCYSGAFAEGWRAKSMGLDLQKELGAEGRVVLTSSSATQTSFQQEDAKLSLYTQYWVEGITTGAADIDGDGKICARELHEYAKGKVRKAKPAQKPEIISDKEGYNILLSLAPVNDPELFYRQEVERYAIEGKISIRAQHILRIKSQDLQISDERSDEIINEALAPYRKYLENIELYKKVFVDTLEEEYPLSDRLLKELQDLQDALGLEEKDVAELQQKILAEKDKEKVLIAKYDKDGKQLWAQLVNQNEADTNERQQEVNLPSEARIDYTHLLDFRSQDAIKSDLMSWEEMRQKIVTRLEEETRILASREVELLSEKGIDYTHLRNLLAAGKWKQADLETAKQMLEATGRIRQGWLEEEDINNFPCKDLRTIDRLWVRYSEGHFGLYVQAHVYDQLGGAREYDKEIWEAFGDRVGWRSEGEWLLYKSLTFDKKAPRAHLPGRWCEMAKGVGGVVFSRVTTCGL